MKKLIIAVALLVLLILLGTIKIYEQTISAEKVIEDGENITEDKDDLEFYLSPDEDSSGWTQTSGPLGGIVISSTFAVFDSLNN